MKLLMPLIAMLFCLSLFAHEGHGEMPTEPARFGGILGNVVDETKMQKKEKHNPSLMKAEIVRSEDGTVRLYLYDLKMNLVKTDDLSKEAKGTIENRKAKIKDQFVLQLHGNHYMGKAPKPKKRPFSVFISFTRGSEKLFVGFDNLD